jgi:hypothetical protein
MEGGTLVPRFAARSMDRIAVYSPELCRLAVEHEKAVLTNNCYGNREVDVLFENRSRMIRREVADLQSSERSTFKSKTDEYVLNPYISLFEVSHIAQTMPAPGYVRYSDNLKSGHHVPTPGFIL